MSFDFDAPTWEQAPFGTHAFLGSYAGPRRYGLFDRGLTISGPNGEERRELTVFDEFHEVVAGEMGIGLDRASLARAWEKIGGQ